MTEDPGPERRRTARSDEADTGRDAPRPGLERSPFDDWSTDDRDPDAAYREDIAPETGPASLEVPAAGFPDDEEPDDGERRRP